MGLSEQHWGHRRVRGHLVLAVAGVSSLSQSHMQAHALLSGGVYLFTLLLFTFCLSLTHMTSRLLVSSASVRWGGESEAEGWEEIISSRGGEEERRLEGIWRWSCVYFVGVFYLFVCSGLSLSVCVCVYKRVCGWVKTLTALQGLFAPRQHSARQHACRGQPLQGQHVLTLLPERRTDMVCVCVTGVWIKRESRW